MCGWRKYLVVNAALFIFVAAVAPGALAQDDQKELAEEIENPVTDLVTVLFQNNWSFNAGPNDKTGYLLNTQLHIPISLNDDWYLITRPVFPVISQPGLFPGGERETGLGDINISTFLVPAKPRKIIWGVGFVSDRNRRGARDRKMGCRTNGGRRDHPGSVGVQRDRGPTLVIRRNR